VVAGVVGILLSVLVLFVTVIGGVTGAQDSGLDLSLTGLILQANHACVVGGPVTGLDPQQAANAEAIVTAAFADSGENADVAQVAVMVAYTESDLQNLGAGRWQRRLAGAVPAAGQPGLGDRGRGARPGRGDGDVRPAAPGHPQLADVAALGGRPGRPVLRVRRNPEPGQRRLGNRRRDYQANWELAGLFLAVIVADGSTPGSCGQGVSGGLAGPATSDGLPAGYAIPAGTGAAHATAVAYALAQLGKPYLWGAAGPDAFDCSGLTQAAWATAGVHLLHYTGDQQQEGQAVTAGQLMAGDLVLTPGSDQPGPDVAGHVGIYLGAGLVESAIDPQMGVAVQTWQAFVSGASSPSGTPTPPSADNAAAGDASAPGQGVRRWRRNNKGSP
jgi:cell wall-associated NlpC family hydrolase